MRSEARLLFALFVLLALLGVFNLQVLRGLSSAFRLSRRARRWVLAALSVPLVSVVLFRVLSRWLPIGSGQSFAVAASSVELGVVMTGVLLSLWMACLGLFDRGARLWDRRSASIAAPTEQNGAKTPSEAPSPEPSQKTDKPLEKTTPKDDPSLGRRAFVERAAAGVALLVGSGSAGYGALFGRHDYDLCTVPVPIPGLPKALDGFTIVQLSDIHLGMMVGAPEMRAAEELVRKAKGDLIVLTGDLIDYDARYTEALGRLVRRLTELRKVVAVPGNHDYYTGIDAVLGALRKAGAKPLVNESVMIGDKDAGFILAGVDDVWNTPKNGSSDRTGGPDLARALSGAHPEAPRIVLCHNPVAFPDHAGEAALQLSGHTHGGQVNFGVRPVDYVLRHPYIAGLYEAKGSRIYVNRGFGTAGPPVRVGAPPEVTRIVLVAA